MQSGKIELIPSESVAPGQVLLKGCSDNFITALIQVLQKKCQASSCCKTEAKTAKVPIAKTACHPVETMDFSEVLKAVGHKGVETGVNAACEAAAKAKNGVSTAIEAMTDMLAHAVEQLENHAEKHTEHAEATQPVAKTETAPVANTAENALELRGQLAQLLTSNKKFVETLRLAIKHDMALNPDSANLTTKSLKAAIALYSHYSTSGSFKIKDAVAAYSKTAGDSPGLVYRLSKNLTVLTRESKVSNPNYHVDPKFEQHLLFTIKNKKFEALRTAALAVDTKIKALV